MFAAYVFKRTRNDERSHLPKSKKTTEESDGVSPTKSDVPQQIIWENVVVYIIVHIAALYGLYLSLTSAMWKTLLFAVSLDIINGVGITAGAHRLWCHRSYKAKLPLRIFLALANSMAFQKDIFYWCRDHRTHHKYSETNADPHNSKRGFFFSHVGWLLVKKHPDVIEKGKTIDLSDLLEDPVVRYQKKCYIPLAVFMCFVLPTIIPMMLWEENLQNSFFVAGILRYVSTFNQTALVNSAAHMWGYRPYDKHIKPADNSWIAAISLGEGFHNYHHTFPWDYATSEIGTRLNISTLFLNFAAWLGLAYDLKTASPAIIQARKLRNDASQK